MHGGMVQEKEHLATCANVARIVKMWSEGQNKNGSSQAENLRDRTWNSRRLALIRSPTTFFKKSMKKHLF